MSVECEAKSISQVGEKLLSLEKSISLLQDVISNVINRLEPVLMPPMPTGQADGLKNPATLVAVASTLQARINDIGSATDRLKDILNRIEL